jgi:DNA-binding MarR family transcriptional regulator
VTEAEECAPESAVLAARELRAVFGRLYRRFKELADNHDLTPSQASVLSRLGKDGPATASDLAAAERVRPQAIAQTVAALEARGLVDRRPDAGDGRRRIISLSAGGRAVFDGSQRVHDEWLTRAMDDHYDETERQALLDAFVLLQRLTR